MKKTTIQMLGEFGQSAWLDNINRSMINDGNLREMIDLGLRGMTSNPSIFHKAITSSDDYDEEIQRLYEAGKSPFDIYDELTVKDVQDAADMFRPLYDKTYGLDGYVSLEVNPKLSDMADETILEARRLFKKVNRPNVMLKIPATWAGYKVIEELISCGINVNATLIFSVAQYEEVANAYIRGLSRLLERKIDLNIVRSVASVFVSRIDTGIDGMLRDKDNSGSLEGRAAVANSRMIFKKYLDIFSEEKFKELERKGANIQRLLWASTSTKNYAYSDIKYVSELIGKNTINTLPDNTFKAFLDHGIIKEAMTSDVDEAVRVIESLKTMGIDVNEVCNKLLNDGIRAFEESFDSLLSSIEKKAGVLCKK